MNHARKLPFAAILVRDEDNARQVYEGIEELAESIRAHGLLQPLLVYERKQKTTRDYHLRAGFRRYKALALIRETERRFLDEVPVIVKSGNDVDAAVDGLVENLARKSITPGELALGLSRLATGIKQREIADRVGLSPSYVSNLLHIWGTFSETERATFVAGKIAADVAHALADLAPEARAEAFKAAQDAATAEVEGGNGVGDPKRAARKAAREATRPRPTVKQVQTYLSEACPDEGRYWQGVRMGLEWAIGKRKAVPGPS